MFIKLFVLVICSWIMFYLLAKYYPRIIVENMSSGCDLSYCKAKDCYDDSCIEYKDGYYICPYEITQEGMLKGKYQDDCNQCGSSYKINDNYHLGSAVNKKCAQKHLNPVTCSDDEYYDAMNGCVKKSSIKHYQDDSDYESDYKSDYDNDHDSNYYNCEDSVNLHSCLIDNVHKRYPDTYHTYNDYHLGKDFIDHVFSKLNIHSIHASHTEINDVGKLIKKITETKDKKQRKKLKKQLLTVIETIKNKKTKEDTKDDKGKKSKDHKHNDSHTHKDSYTHKDSHTHKKKWHPDCKYKSPDSFDSVWMFD